MNSYIVLFATLANVIAILLVYYSFGKKAEKQKKFMNTLIAVGFMYIVILIVYNLSSIGIERVSASEQAKTLMTIAFVPVNTILFIPIMVRSYMKVKAKKLTMDQFTVRSICIVILAVVALVCEFVYFRNFQKDIVRINEQLENTVSENEVKSENNVNYTNSNSIINEIGDYETEVDTEVVEENLIDDFINNEI